MICFYMNELLIIGYNFSNQAFNKLNQHIMHLLNLKYRDSYI